MKAQYPFFDTKSVQTPTSTTLRITDGRQRRDEALKAWGHAFKLIVKEARPTPDIVTICVHVFYVWLLHV